MKILFVGMPDSIHTVRWISQIVDQGWEIYLFPTSLTRLHPMMKNITFFGSRNFQTKNLSKSIHFIQWPILYFLRNWIRNQIKHTHDNKYKEQALKLVIRKLKPDIIHSLEFQHAGYITLGAKNNLKEKFPKWIVSNWGSDIYLFYRIPEHQGPIQLILENCDYYSCECNRDVNLAQKIGLKGKVLPTLPNSGGMHIDDYLKFRQPGPISKRKTIIVKGYQHWAGRALVVLQAFRFCIDALKEYSILIYSASEDVRIAALIFAQETKLQIELIPESSHENILALFGKSRIYIGLSISDGISTSLLEAMVMGAFPIQSCTACADEWIVCGQSGFIVPPEDPQKIANAISIALRDDVLVDQATEINSKTINERLNYSAIQSEVIEMYKQIYIQNKE